MIRFLHRHIVLPAYESGLKRRRAFRYWRELEDSQWLPRHALEERRLRAVRRLLSHAFTNCPYYRQHWCQAGLDPADVRSLGDLHRWPVIDRESVRVNRFEMRCRSPQIRLISKSTGGSTGVPLHFDLDTDSNDRRTAAWHRGYNWAGAAPGTKQLYLWGVPLGERSGFARCKDRLYNRLYRRVVFNSFELEQDRADEFLRQLDRCRPDVVVAYTSALWIVARAAKERGVRPFSPGSIVVGAEKLHPFQRALIEEVFAAPVFETYGSREFMLIGAECERHQGLHLTAENLLVEILDDDGRPTPAGEEGNVVITDLYNYGMPFVRFANGDRAVAGRGACACGRGLPLLRKVVGRRLDVLHTPDGRQIPGEFFPHLVKEFHDVRRFQVVQDAPDHVELRVITGAGWSDQDQRRLEQSVRTTLGQAVRFDLLRVSDIPLSPAGKFQVVVNKCPADSLLPAGGR